MISQSLHEGWTLEILGKNRKYPAKVPGTVYGALLEAGSMEDPFWRDNELKALQVMEDDFLFETAFVPAEGAAGPEGGGCDSLRSRFLLFRDKAGK